MNRKTQAPPPPPKALLIALLIVAVWAIISAFGVNLAP
jgi:hypothetical protein